MNINEIKMETHPGIGLKTWSDDVYSHYMLVGERFDEQKILLDLMLKYAGACKQHQVAADMDINCELNCQQCKHSIYHELEVRRHAATARNTQLCTRLPKPGDEWEVNLVMRKGKIPKFQTFFWNVNSGVHSDSIIDIIFNVMSTYNSGVFFQSAQLCYVKIRRFDEEKPIDVSRVANAMLKERCRAEGVPFGIN